MDERHLLILGLLMTQSRHGYSINEFIETNLGCVSGMKRATAYALLEKLERQGLVQMGMEVVGNYPPRKVYSLTPAGRDAFFGLLHELLVKVDERSAPFDIALMFADWLDRQSVIALLRERARNLQALAGRLRATPVHKRTPSVNDALEHRLALLRAEEEWIRSLIERLEESTPEGNGFAAEPTATPPGGETI